jgi:hypothetical protein
LFIYLPDIAEKILIALLAHLPILISIIDEISIRGGGNDGIDEPVYVTEFFFQSRLQLS